MFIVIEGIDGAGLSTQAKLLKEFLVSKGKRVLLTKEPTDTAIGGFVKSILRGEFKVNSLTLQLLFTADRAHHLESEIEPALEKNIIVVCDRYFFSTFAFGGLDVDVNFLKKINEKFRLPDITIIIDVPPEVAAERIKKSRLHTELFENLEKAAKVRENYLRLAEEYENVFIVDGNREVDVVAKEIHSIVGSRIF